MWIFLDVDKTLVWRYRARRYLLRAHLVLGSLPAQAIFDNNSGENIPTVHAENASLRKVLHTILARENPDLRRDLSRTCMWVGMKGRDFVTTATLYFATMEENRKSG